MLRVKLRGLEARNARRAEIARYYSSRFGDRVGVPPVDPRRTHVFHQYVIRTPLREALRRHLPERELATGIHYPDPVHRQAAWRAACGDGPSLPGAEHAADEILSLPVHPDLPEGEVEHVGDSVVGFFD